MTFIRAARPGDIDALLAIEFESFRHDRLSRRAISAAIPAKGQSLLVAINDAEILVGYCLIHYRAGARHARLYSIAVAAQVRGGGIGRMLLMAAEAHALEKGMERMRLEVRRSDEQTASFYRRHGYTPKRVIPEYYSDGEAAVQKEKALRAPENGAIISERSAEILIVTSRTRDQKPFEGAANGTVRLLTATDYLAKPELSEGVKQVINVCPVDEYLNQGYYVSLLARARAQRALPNIDTVSGLIWKKIYRNHLHELTALTGDRVPSNLAGDKHGRLAIEVFFGQTRHEWAKRMAARAYRLFPAPILEIALVRDKGKWVAEYIWPLSIAALNSEATGYFLQALTEYCQSRRNPVTRRRKANFDLAILFDPKEAYPPSDEDAIKAFMKSAERHNLHAEVISKKDGEKLTRFDALFIRQTTNIDNHTFTFARKAEAVGMPVIDDSVSILRCSNKVYLREAMTRARIATPVTHMVTKANLRETAAELCWPTVLKVPDGSFSRGVTKARDIDEFMAKAGKMLEDSFIILAQEYMPTEFDWRIGVLDGKPLFAARYHMAPGHWQVYDHTRAGINWGNSEYLPVADAPKAIVRSAVRASLQMGRGLYGVDMKEAGGKPYVIEVNDNPNIDAGYEDTELGEKLYDTIMSHFRERILAAKGLSRPQQLATPAPLVRPSMK